MRRNPLVAGAVTLLGLLALAFGLVLPRGSEVALTEGRLARAESALAESNLRLVELRAIDPADISADLQEVRAQVPASSALPELLRSLSDAADRAGVSLGAITLGAGSASAAASVSAISITTSASGGYFPLARFLFELEHLDRLVRVSSFALAAGGAEGLTVSITAEVYTTDPAVGPGADPAPGAEVGS